MSLEIISIGSSSSGNSYVIRSDETVLLLDTGLSGKKIKEAFASLSIELTSVKAILITHEHVDHVQSVKVMARACPEALVYASRGTVSACSKLSELVPERVSYVTAGDTIEIGDIEIETFALSHDAAEPLGYAMKHEDDHLVVVTDTGIVTDEIFAQLVKANKLVFESNYEENLLLMGPYPYSVKRRILGDYGHLSNELSGKILSEMLARRTEDAAAPKIMLAHVSTTNNTPSQARHTVQEILKKNNHHDGSDYHMTIAAKEGITRL